MNSTAQLPGVNRPLSVELRLINFCACGLDSRGKHDTSFSRGVLTKRSDFPRAKGAVRCSPFGGVEFGKTSRLGSTGFSARGKSDEEATVHRGEDRSRYERKERRG